MDRSISHRYLYDMSGLFLFTGGSILNRSPKALLLFGDE